METLASPSHYSKYVTENKRLDEVRFRIAQGKDSPVLFLRAGVLTRGKRVYKAGEPLTVVSTKKISVSRVDYAEVRIGSEKGLLPLSAVSVPEPRGFRTSDDPVSDIDRWIVQSGGVIDLKIKGSPKVHSGLRYAVRVTPAILAGRGPAAANIVICQDKRQPVAPSSVYLRHTPSSRQEAADVVYATILREVDSKRLRKNESVQAFLTQAMEVIEAGKGKAVMSEELDEDLVRLALYGSDYKVGGRPGLRSVHAIGSGEPVFGGSRGVTELSFSRGTRTAGTIGTFFGTIPDLAPVLAVIPSPGKTLEAFGRRYPGLEAGVYPLAAVRGRRGLVLIQPPSP